MKQILVYYICFLFLSCGKPAIDPFAAALNNMADQVKQIIDHGQSAGLILEVTAGSQVLNAIIQAKQAYEEGLIKTSSTMSAQQQQIINGLNASITALNKHILQGLTLRVQSIVNTIPFSKTFPQLLSYSGTITNGLDNYATIKIIGNFFDIGMEGYESFIKINGEIIKNTIRTGSILSFMIPKKIIKKDTDKITYIPLSVYIPYRKGFFNKKTNAIFELILIVLPGAGPGKIAVIQNKPIDVKVDTIITTNFKTWDAGNGDVDLVQGFDVIPGWIVDVNSVEIKMVPGSEHGSFNKDWYNYGNSSTPTWVGWHILATHKNNPFGNNGAVSMIFTYRAYKFVSYIKDFKTDSLNLAWGESSVVTIDPMANWKIVYKQFDGKKFEIASNTRNNAYLKFDQTGRELQISSVPFPNDLE